MEQTMKVLVEAKLIPSVKLDDCEAATLAKASLTSLREAHASEIQVKDKEIAELKTERDAARKAEAESIVADAVKAGKIKDDTALRGKWVSAVLKDRDSATAMLEGIEVKRKVTSGREPLEDDGDGGESKEVRINRLQAECQKERDPVKAGLLVREIRKLRNGEAKN